MTAVLRADRLRSDGRLAADADVDTKPARSEALQLSKRVLEGLRLGPEAVAYAGDKGLFLAAALSAGARQYTFDEYYRGLTRDPRFAYANERLHDLGVRRGHQEILKYLLERWNTAERKVRQSGQIQSRHDVSLHWSQVIHLAVTTPLPRKGGAAALSALLTIALHGQARGDIAPPISRLEFELSGGLSRTGVENALNRLRDSGLVTAHAPAQHGWRNRWTISTDVLRTHSAAIGGAFIGGIPRPKTHPRLLPVQDIWTPSPGLGLEGWRVYLLLNYLHEPSLQIIGDATGANSRVVANRLKTLVEVGLSLNVGDEEWRPGPSTLDEAAQTRDVVGRAAQRAEKAVQRAEAGRRWFNQREAAISKSEQRKDAYDEWKDQQGDKHRIVDDTGKVRFIVHDDSYEAYLRDRGHQADLSGTDPRNDRGVL